MNGKIVVSGQEDSMKKVIWALALLTLIPSMSYGQNRAAVEKTLIANEQKINEAVAKGDRATYLALIAPGAVSVDKTGFIPASEFAKYLDRVKVTSWKIENPRVMWIDSNNAIVTYAWTGAGTFMNQPVDSPVLATTLWTKKGNKWLAVFHTETAKR